MNLYFYIAIAFFKLSQPGPRSFKYPEYRRSVEFQRFLKILKHLSPTFSSSLGNNPLYYINLYLGLLVKIIIFGMSRPTYTAGDTRSLLNNWFLWILLVIKWYQNNFTPILWFLTVFELIGVILTDWISENRMKIIFLSW